MSDRTQDIKNLRAVATACKNYTDKKIEDLRWELGTYDLGVESDNTSALVKTMPSGTIKANVNKIYGASEVSENLIVLQDVAQTTTNGITYSISKGVLTISGTATDSVNISLGLEKTLSAGSYYLELFNWQTNLGIDYYIINQNYTYDFYNTSSGASQIKSMTFNGNELLRRLDFNIANGTVISGTLQLKPMLVKGTTAPSEFKVGFEGIHNLELSGLKVEGANLFDVSTIKYGRYGTSTGSTSDYCSDYIEVMPNTQYYVSGSTGGYHFIIGFDENKQVAGVLVNNTNVKTFTTQANCKYITYSSNLTVGNVPRTIIISIGNSEVSPYVPYVAPTTKTIDLSTILYNDSPLFEGNSLKGVNDVKDILTPYKATKKVGSRTYQSGDEEDTSVLTDGTTTLYELATPIEVSIDWSSTLRNIQGYSNGSITAQNTYDMATTSEIDYLVEEVKA